MKWSRLVVEIQHQARLFMAVLMVSALLVGATIAIIEPKQKLDAVLVLQAIVALAVLMRIIFELISRANYASKDFGYSMPENDRQDTGG